MSDKDTNIHKQYTNDENLNTVDLENNDTDTDFAKQDSVLLHEDVDESFSDDVEFAPDEENSGGNSLSGDSKLKKLKLDLEKIKKEKEEYLLNWQKERADFQNFKRGEDDRLTRAKNLGFEKGIMGVIKMLDTFDMAFANKESWNNVDPSWRTGVEYIYQQGIQFLEDNMVSVINPNSNSVVDITMHDVVESINTDDDSKDSLIANVLQKGYKIKDTIIRPARVQVYKKP